MRDVSGNTRRAIAAMHLQSNSFLATHAGSRDTTLYGPAIGKYRSRCCIWLACANPGPVDDAIHVLFECPHMAQQRKSLLQAVNAQLSVTGLALADLGSRQRQAAVD